MRFLFCYSKFNSAAEDFGNSIKEIKEELPIRLNLFSKQKKLFWHDISKFIP